MPQWRSTSPVTRVYTPTQSRTTSPSPLLRQLSSRVSPVATRNLSPPRSEVVYVGVQQPPTFTPSSCARGSPAAFAYDAVSPLVPSISSPAMSYRSARSAQESCTTRTTVYPARTPETSYRRPLAPNGTVTPIQVNGQVTPISVEGWRDTIRRRMHEKIRAGPEQLRMIFERYDVNRDGDLSEPEVKRLVIDTLEWAEFFLQEQKQKFLQHALEVIDPEEQRQMNVYAILIDRQVSTISQSKVELTDVGRYVRKLDRDRDSKVSIEDFVANGNKVLVDILSSVIGSDLDKLSESRKVERPQWK